MKLRSLPSCSIVPALEAIADIGHPQGLLGGDVSGLRTLAG
jgi:hypothetical protein